VIVYACAACVASSPPASSTTPDTGAGATPDLRPGGSGGGDGAVSPVHEAGASSPDATSTGADLAAAPPTQDANGVDVPAQASDGPVASTDAPAASVGAGCSGGVPTPKEGIHDLMVGAAPRRFFLRLPASYDGRKAWPVIFAFHGAGNKSAAWFDTNTDLRAVTEEQAVLLFPEGAERPDGTLSWVHLSSENVAFTDAMIDWLKANVCIDASRLFAVGQSSGGYMAMTLGCQRGGVFRGVATSSGGILTPGPCTGSPAIVWMRTGRGDTVATRQSVVDTRAFWLGHKTCGKDAPRPVAPAPCVGHGGCQGGAQVLWCEDDGGHGWPGYMSRGLWALFSASP
jgi:polyhydroxybutyrate depolymerase